MLVALKAIHQESPRYQCGIWSGGLGFVGGKAKEQGGRSHTRTGGNFPSPLQTNAPLPIPSHDPSCSCPAFGRSGEWFSLSWQVGLKKQLFGRRSSKYCQKHARTFGVGDASSLLMCDWLGLRGEVSPRERQGFTGWLTCSAQVPWQRNVGW